MNPFYDSTDQNSILRHARELEGSCIEDTLQKYSDFMEDIHEDFFLYAVDENFRGKGRFGQFLENQYFKLEINNHSHPDFHKANLELKTVPLKRLKSNNQLRAKERIVLGIIDYFRLVDEEFDNSHLLFKNSEILLVFYIHDQLLQLKNLKVELVDIWRCLQEDRQQIERDWNDIVSKVKNGEADKLSEGDTFLLGACTKGSTRLKSMVNQPYSENKAMKRALCFKINYVNHIFDTLNRRKQSKDRVVFEERLVPKDTSDSLEDAVRKLLLPYINMTAPDIARERSFKYNPQDKARYARIVSKLLGLDRKNKVIYEFSAAGIEVKTVRVLKNGNLPESMSFKAIRFCDIVEEEWEDSDFFQSVVSKFLIVVFKEDYSGEFYLSGFKFWNMPLEDYQKAEELWNDTREKIARGDYSQFIKQSKSFGVGGIGHIRPHGVRGQLELTPQGTLEPPKSFWFDKIYVKSIINDLL